jgi:hypothetical protein
LNNNSSSSGWKEVNRANWSTLNLGSRTSFINLCQKGKNIWKGLPCTSWLLQHSTNALNEERLIRTITSNWHTGNRGNWERTNQTEDTGSLPFKKLNTMNLCWPNLRAEWDWLMDFDGHHRQPKAMKHKTN